MPFSADESCRPSSAIKGGIFGPILSWDLHLLDQWDCRGKTTLKEEHNKHVILIMAAVREDAEDAFFVHPPEVDTTIIRSSQTIESKYRKPKSIENRTFHSASKSLKDF